MEVKLIDQDKEKNKVSFLLKDATPALANLYRRTVLEDVPTMAVEDVEFRKNNSILYDEIIAHRLGLLPLTTDLKSYDIVEEGESEEKTGPKYQLTLTLKAKGPATVYASEIESKDSAVKPVFGKTPIVKLLKNQSLELEATAVLGRGKTHAKWSPGHIYYKHKVDVQIDNNKIDDKGKCVEMVPKGVLKLDGDKLSVDPDKIYDAEMCDVAAELYPDAIKITNTNDFVFYLEAWGQLSPKEIMVQAASIVDAKLDELTTKLKEAKLSQ